MLCLQPVVGGLVDPVRHADERLHLSGRAAFEVEIVRVPDERAAVSAVPLESDVLDLAVVAHALEVVHHLVVDQT